MREGSKVKWEWGNGHAEGEVVETYTSSVTKTLKGTDVTRNGSDDDKALLIKQEDGDQVLKLESEVEHVN